MAKHQKTLLKDAARALLEVDKSKLDLTEKHMLNKAYAICSQQLFKMTGKHFLELEHPKPTETYIVGKNN